MSIYFIRFFSNFALAGFYPFLAVWLLNTTDLESFGVSLIISVGIFTSRLGSAVCATWVKNHAKRNVLIVSSILLILVISTMYGVKVLEWNSLTIWLILAVLWGVLVSVITLAILAYIANRSSGEQQKTEFSYVNIALNLSAGVAPIAGSNVLAYNPEYLPAVPIIALIFSLFFTFALPTKESSSNTKDKDEDNQGDLSAFVILCIINFLTFISYSHFANILARYADDYTGQEMVGILFFVASIAMVIAQVPANKLAFKMDSYKVMMIANVFAALGTFGLVALAGEMIALCIISVISIAISIVLYVPLYQSLAIKTFSGNSTYALAIITVMWGLAEGLSVIFAFHLIDAGMGTTSYLIGGASALLAALLALMYKRHFQFKT